jgi:uncharacterized protein (DUF342 family)
MSKLEKKINKIRLSSNNSSVNSSNSDSDESYDQINDIYSSMSDIIEDLQLNIVLLTNKYLFLKQEIENIKIQNNNEINNIKIQNNNEINNIKKSIIENRNILLQTLDINVKQIKKEFKEYTIKDIDILINNYKKTN